MRRILRTALFTLGLSLNLCACSDTNEANQAETLCACPEGVCPTGQCVLKVVIADPCWGDAKIFVGETGPEAEPVGTASIDSPFVNCEGFGAPVFDGNTGDVVQAAEAFEFVVESEDGRAVAGAVSGQTFTCADSAPFVFTAQGCQ